MRMEIEGIGLEGRTGMEGVNKKHTHNKSKLFVEREGERESERYREMQSFPLSIDFLVLQRPSSAARHGKAYRIPFLFSVLLPILSEISEINRPTDQLTDQLTDKPTD